MRGVTDLGAALSGQKLESQNDGQWEDFYALTDVSFDVEQGERIGIIGRNGAGKSTLLKILSRITEPSSGRIDITGRVASLLEVGTGFHPELTGRENIFLNAAILGMTRQEVIRRFDEIVAFAGVERFLDTPVKRYSSGMYVRLAFAVAAHLESEIVIVDEVLAVGDGEFQKRCLEKMQEISGAGRTIIFVSHSMVYVSSLCTKCLLMQSGQLIYTGETAKTLEHYASLTTSGRTDSPPTLDDYRPSWAKPIITSACILDEDRRETKTIPLGAEVTVQLVFNLPDGQFLDDPIMGIVFRHTTFGPVGNVNMRMTGTHIRGPFQSAVMECRVPRVPFLQGPYYVEVWLGDGPVDVDMLDKYLTLNIEETDLYGSGRSPVASLGVVFLEPDWQIQAVK